MNMLMVSIILLHVLFFFYSCAYINEYEEVSACKQGVLSRDVAPKCDTGSVIYVIDAHYGIEMDDCTQNKAGKDESCLSVVDSDVFKDIRNKCNDKVYCNYLEALESSQDMYYSNQEDDCAGFSKSDFIHIKYRCIKRSDTPTKIDTPEGNATGLSLSSVGAIVLAVGLLVIIVALIGRIHTWKQLNQRDYASKYVRSSSHQNVSSSGSQQDSSSSSQQDSSSSSQQDSPKSDIYKGKRTDHVQESRC